MNSLQKDFIEKFNSINFEQIKDHPNILIAANFWDEDRYQAAKTCYKFMRAIDDLIDNHKAEYKTITESEMCSTLHFPKSEVCNFCSEHP